jgi:hypothetical protein
MSRGSDDFGENMVAMPVRDTEEGAALAAERKDAVRGLGLGLGTGGKSNDSRVGVGVAAVVA